ncbi:MAG: TolC family protein [Cyclobacteriaceae bacterium]
MNIRLITILIFLVPIFLSAQEKTFSLEDCIEYALENATDVKNAILDEELAEAQIKETIGIGLPQISGTVVAQKSPTLQRFYGQWSPNSSIGPNADQAQQLGIEEGDVYAAENFFQLQSAGDASLSINQLIFNGSYIVGLQASRVFKELSVNQKEETAGQRKADVAKAYFNVLVNEDRLKLFAGNLARLDTLYRNTVELNKNGFAEEIEVDRLKVSLNNLKSEEDNLKNLNILSMRLLKFQMNYPINQPLKLSGKIEDVLSRSIVGVTDEVVYNDRADYRVLIENKKLQELNLKNKYAEALPTIGAFANLGYSTQSPDFTGLFSTRSDFSEAGGVGPDGWYKYSSIGLRLNWSIFTGLQRNYQIQQQKIELKKIDNSLQEFESLIEVQVKEAELTFTNAMQKFEVQKENAELAEKIFRISQTKYEEGVGSNLEVVEADSALKDAQANYFNALFEAIVAKIDLNRALGREEE